MNTHTGTEREKGALLVAVGTIMVQEGVSAPQARDEKHTDRVVELLMQNGIDEMRARDIVEWELTEVVE